MHNFPNFETVGLGQVQFDAANLMPLLDAKIFPVIYKNILTFLSFQLNQCFEF